MGLHAAIRRRSKTWTGRTSRAAPGRANRPSAVTAPRLCETPCLPQLARDPVLYRVHLLRTKRLRLLSYQRHWPGAQREDQAVSPLSAAAEQLLRSPLSIDAGLQRAVSAFVLGHRLRPVSGHMSDRFQERESNAELGTSPDSGLRSTFRTASRTHSRPISRRAAVPGRRSGFR